MSKFDTLIYSYLVEHKRLSMEKIGHLAIDQALPTADKENPHPHLFSVINFTADKKALSSEDFIEYCAKELQKKKSLITSDIESFFEQARQFINIGKPFTLPGVGMITIAKSGVYQFIESDSAIKLDMPLGATTAYETEAETRKGVQNQQRFLMRVAAIGIGLLVIAVLAVLAYKFVSDKAIQPVVSTTNTEEVIAAKPDTMATPTVDTAAANQATASVLATDTVTYKFIFEETGKRGRAVSRTTKLRGFGNMAEFDSIVKQDSTIYRLFLPVKSIVADTARKKDSLQRYLQRSIIIE